MYQLDENLERKVVELLSERKYGLSINDLYSNLLIPGYYLKFGYLEFESFLLRSEKFELRESGNTEKLKIKK